MLNRILNDEEVHNVSVLERLRQVESYREHMGTLD